MEQSPFDSGSWPVDIIQLLDDHHLVVLSDSGKTRVQFGNRLAQHLKNFADTEVVNIDGMSAIDLLTFCKQLEKQVHIDRTRTESWRNVRSVIDALRHATRHPKRRYVIWHEAEAMLDTDVDLFCKLVNGLFGVAAEFEHIDMEPLLVQRVVFIGGDKLGAYAEDCDGQFSRWLDDSEESPFWEVASVLERPPVLTYRLDG